MSNAIARISGNLCLVAGLTFGLCACESEFAPDRSRSAQTRSVQSPTGHNDALGEEMAGQQDGVPLVTVEFPNREGQSPRIRTIGDNVRDTLNPPATQPTNVGTPGQPATRPSEIQVNPL